MSVSMRMYLRSFELVLVVSQDLECLECHTTSTEPQQTDCVANKVPSTAQQSRWPTLIMTTQHNTTQHQTSNQTTKQPSNQARVVELSPMGSPHRPQRTATGKYHTSVVANAQRAHVKQPLHHHQQQQHNNRTKKHQATSSDHTPTNNKLQRLFVAVQVDAASQLSLASEFACIGRHTYPYSGLPRKSPSTLP